MKISEKILIWIMISFGYVGFLVTTLNTYIDGTGKPNIIVWAAGIITYIIGSIILFSHKDKTKEVKEK